MTNKSKEYQNGFDAGLNGANLKNSHFGNFATKEQTKDWEEGKRAGEKAKANQAGRKPKPHPRKK